MKTSRPSRLLRSCALVAAMTLAGAASAVAQVPSPEDVFGFQPGADYELADYDMVLDYLHRLDDASERVRMVQIGESTRERPMMLLFISSEENLERLDRWREISATLARARVPEDEARRLAEEGKAIVWIDGGMHATERAHAQMTPQLAYNVATLETDEMRKIRDNVIFLLMPNINPDGLEIVADWWERVKDTPFATTGPPWLYQTYVGHDNNRDWYMLLQRESRNVARVLYEEWYPQIVYNQHQSSPEWTRIFHPPFADPVNQKIPPEVIKGVNLVGEAMGKRFQEKEMPGAISRLTFDMWWNGGMRTAPYYHNMVGILTETAHTTPVPRYYDPAERPATVGGRRAGSPPTDRPTLYYPDPWEGGWSRFADAVHYMIEGSYAVLEIGADRRQEWLMGMYRMGRRAIRAGEAGEPFAYIITPDQWMPDEAVNLVNVLRRGGVEVHRAAAPFSADGERYAAGSYLVYAAQPFRAHLWDLLEPQNYPDRRMYPGGPPEPPYDLAGWTLPYQMGVNVRRIDESFRVRTEIVDRASPDAGAVAADASWGWALSHRPNASALAVNRLLEAGDRVSWADGSFSAGSNRYEAGTILVEARGGTSDRVERLARDLGLDFHGLSSRPTATQALRRPHIGIYKSWVANMDEGWTRWLLREYEFQVDTLHDADVRTRDLSEYDAIILPDQEAAEILNGHAEGAMPKEYVGGLGLRGADALETFVREGGTLITLDAASDLAIQQFGLPVRNAVAGVPAEEFFIPGSLLDLRVDASHPYAYGMQEDATAFFVRSRAFEVVQPAAAGERRAPYPAVEVIARYPHDDLLESGWALNAERYLGGKAAMVRVRHGQGDVVMIGFRAQMRGQPRNTFKLLFNPLHGSTVEDLPVAAESVFESGSERHW